MAYVLKTSLTCARCLGEIPVGGRYVAMQDPSRGVRHGSKGDCARARPAQPVPRPVVVAAPVAPTNRPALGYDRSALDEGEGFYGDSGRHPVRARQDVYGGDEG